MTAVPAIEALNPGGAVNARRACDTVIHKPLEPSLNYHVPPWLMLTKKGTCPLP